MIIRTLATGIVVNLAEVLASPVSLFFQVYPQSKEDQCSSVISPAQISRTVCSELSYDPSWP